MKSPAAEILSLLNQMQHENSRDVESFAIDA